jgi:hypothetical protein
MKGRDHFQDLYIDGTMILKCILQRKGMKMWTGLNWLKIKSNGGVLCVWKLIFCDSYEQKVF